MLSTLHVVGNVREEGEEGREKEIRLASSAEHRIGLRTTSSRTGHVPQGFPAGDGPRESRLWGGHHEGGRVEEEGHPALWRVGMDRAPGGDHAPRVAEA